MNFRVSEYDNFVQQFKRLKVQEQGEGHVRRVGLQNHTSSMQLIVTYITV